MDLDTSGCGCVTGGGDGVLYSGAAAVGRVYATIGAIVGVIIALILIIVGTVRLRDPHTQTVNATVTQAYCPKAGDNPAMTSCVVSVRYTVDGVTYTADNIALASGSPSVAPGDVITLWYLPGNPRDIVSEMGPRATGWAMIGIGLLIGGITSGIAYGTYKSKAFAAGYGAVEGISTVARVL